MGVTRNLSMAVQDRALQWANANPFPLPQLQVFASDLKVIQVGADYYFKALVGSDLLITGYDFPTGWTKGFPYKSAATIDIFGQTAVPVVSLFQNFDYADTYFCKHAAQVVDGNGVETYEARVSGIVAYSAALTGADLTAANTYFGTPTESGTALWVSPTGLDSQAGSKALPWLTLDKAFDTENTAKIIYCKSSNQVGDTVLGYLYNAKNNELVCIGKVKTTGNTGYGAYWKDNQVPPRITALIIESSNSTNNLFLDSLPNMVMNKLKLKSTNAAYSIQNRFKELNNSVITGTNVTAGFYQATAQEWFINNSYINLVSSYLLFMLAGSGNPVIKNSKIRGTYSTYAFKAWSTQLLSLIGNDINIQSTNAIIYILSGGSLILTDNTIVANLTGGEGFVHMEDSPTSLSEIRRNRITNNGLTSDIIKIKNTNHKTTHNIINCEDAVYVGFNEINSAVLSASVLANCEITDNKILSKRTSGHNITIGDEATSAGNKKVTNALISRNYVKSATAYGEAANTTHSLFIGFQNGVISHNFVLGGGFGAILKGSDIYTSNIQYNLLIDCLRPAYSKAQSGISIINNTIVNDLITPEFGVWLSSNTGGDAAVNCVIKNNIVAYLGDYATFIAVDIESATNTVDYNIYYTKSATLKFKVAGVEKTFAQWQALGYDTHSIVLTDVQFNALFTDQVNSNYALATGSAAIGAGVDLGATYDDGLDASTNWGTDTQLPVVVTKQQGAAWDCGAYVS